MKKFFSAHKAIQRFLNSQRYHLHGGSRPPCGTSKPYQMPSSSLFSCHYYRTSAILNATESSYRLSNSNNIVDMEIVSRETIKPSSPTPNHLRTFKLSFADQLMYDVYVPFTVFFPNTDKASVTDVVTKRSKHLKESLSKILTRFYPLAGKIKDNLHIECNDDGIHFTEARINQTLQDFLGHPEDETVKRLLPEKPCLEESSIGNYIIGIQVNIFKCGGIGLSSNVSHKIIDGHTLYMFTKAWAAAARGSPEIVSPSFVASEIFPNNPCIKNSALAKSLLTTEILSTKRFVFDSKALALLKAQPIANANYSGRPPTRMEATTAVIWKAAAQAASKVRPFSPESPYVFLPVVNLRRKASPPLPNESMGNLFTLSNAICFPGCPLDLPTLMGELRKSIAKINSDYIESLKGEKGHETINEIVKGISQLTNMTAEGDRIIVTSLLNNGMYDLDFGWGKPIWVYIMSHGQRRVALNDTHKGGGVEAVVTLSSDEMEIFERDSELLSYATVNPSPLRLV